MAKNPEQALGTPTEPRQETVDPNLVLELVGRLEECIDPQLCPNSVARCPDGSFEFVLETQEYTHRSILEAAGPELIKRYKRSETNPQGWAEVTFRVAGRRMLIKLFP